MAMLAAKAAAIRSADLNRIEEQNEGEPQWKEVPEWDDSPRSWTWPILGCAILLSIATWMMWESPTSDRQPDRSSDDASSSEEDDAKSTKGGHSLPESSSRPIDRRADAVLPTVILSTAPTEGAEVQINGTNIAGTTPLEVSIPIDRPRLEICVKVDNWMCDYIPIESLLKNAKYVIPIQTTGP